MDKSIDLFYFSRRKKSNKSQILESSTKLFKEIKYGKNVRIWLAAIGSMVHLFIIASDMDIWWQDDIKIVYTMSYFYVR